MNMLHMWYAPEAGSNSCACCRRRSSACVSISLGLHAFVAIAERGSFQLAAAHLNLSQTALSHRIRKLEEDLGVKLLSRTTREVSLTQAGLDLLPKVKDTIESLASPWTRFATRGAAGRRSLPSDAFRPSRPDACRRRCAGSGQRHPDVMLRIYDNSATEISDLVQAGTIEFGITLVAAHRWDFDIEMLIKDPFTLRLPRGHPLASQSGRELGRSVGRALDPDQPADGQPHDHR